MKRIAFALILAAVIFVPAFAEIKTKTGLKFDTEAVGKFEEIDASEINWETNVEGKFGIDFGFYGLDFIVYDEFKTKYNMTAVKLENDFGFEANSTFKIMDPFNIYVNLPLEIRSKSTIGVDFKPTLGFSGEISGFYYDVNDELDLKFSGNPVVMTVGMVVYANVGYDIPFGEKMKLNLDGEYELEIADFTSITTKHTVEVHANLGLGGFTPNVGMFLENEAGDTTVQLDVGLDYSKDNWTVEAGLLTGSKYSGNTKTDLTEVSLKLKMKV